MYLTIKNKKRLYDAVSEPIMQKRISIQQSKKVIGERNASDLDEMMFRLERQIWGEVSAILGINNG